MTNQNRHQYDIMLAAVDPTTWTIKEVNLFSDVEGIIANAAQSPDLGCVIEGGLMGDIHDINFDELPDYYAVEIPRHSDWKYNYIAMRGHSYGRFEDAMKEAVEFRKKNPEITTEEIATRTNLYINRVVDEYCQRAGMSDRDLIKDSVLFILDRLQRIDTVEEEFIDLPDFVLLPRVTADDSSDRQNFGLRPYPETFNPQMNKQDVLQGLLSLMKEEAFTRSKPMPSMETSWSVSDEINRTYRKLEEAMFDRSSTKEEWIKTARQIGHHLTGVMRRPPWDNADDAPLELILAEFSVYSYMTLMYVEALQKYLLNHQDHKLNVIDLERTFDLAGKTLGVEKPESGQYNYSEARVTLQDKFDPRTEAPISIGVEFG